MNKIQTIAYSLIIIYITGYFLFIGSSIIQPIIFAVLLSVFLNRVDNSLRPIVKIKSLSIVLSFAALVIPIAITTTLFSFQLYNIIDSLPSISSGIEGGLRKLITKINSLSPLINLRLSDVVPSGDASIEGPLKILSQGLVSTTALFTSTGLTLIYSFLFLYYKKSFRNFIIYTVEKDTRPDIKDTLNQIIDTIQSYIGGVGLVMIILSILNTIGLMIIGIDYAIFWGTLAGLLAIIPFIGTLVGGMLPFIYALSSAEASWQPFAILGYYAIIQQIEGNFITPKIVGDKVDINPLFAILSLVLFGSFWGIGGVILALPIISIIKIILGQFSQTEPISILMSSDISNKKGIFKRIANMR